MDGSAMDPEDMARTLSEYRDLIRDCIAKQTIGSTPRESDRILH